MSNLKARAREEATKAVNSFFDGASLENYLAAMNELTYSYMEKALNDGTTKEDILNMSFTAGKISELLAVLNEVAEPEYKKTLSPEAKGLSEALK